MKGKITQYVALGVMLLIIVLIVSFLPAERQNSVTSKQVSPTKVSNLSARTKIAKVRPD